MTYEQLKRIQAQQLRIMDEIHRICIEQGLRYYLIGGSALGAVRHQGFIPWDVDIDIAMPRKDYDLFLAKGNSLLPSGFNLYDYNIDKNFRLPHAIVTLENSILKLSCGREINNKYGIYVDILPLDQWPEDSKKKNKQIKSLQNVKKLLRMYNGDEYEENSLFEKMVKRVISFCMHCIFSAQYLNKKQDYIVSKYYTKNEGHNWCSMLSHYSLDKLTMPKEYFGHPTMMDFEGRRYFVPEKVLLYLHQLFKNYKKYPSIEQRQKQMNLFSYASWINENGIKEEIKNDKI